MLVLRRDMMMMCDDYTAGPLLLLHSMIIIAGYIDMRPRRHYTGKCHVFLNTPSSKRSYFLLPPCRCLGKF